MPKYAYFFILWAHNIVILRLFDIIFPVCVPQMSCIALFLGIFRVFSGFRTSFIIGSFFTVFDT